MQRVCPVNLGALIYGSAPCIKRLRSTVRHHLHLPPGMSATRPHGIVSVHMVQSRRRPKVTAHTCWASVGAMPAGDQLTGTWPGQMQRLSTVVSWSCRRHESSRTRGAAEAGCSGVGCSSRGRGSTRQNAASPGHAVYLSAARRDLARELAETPGRGLQSAVPLSQLGGPVETHSTWSSHPSSAPGGATGTLAHRSPGASLLLVLQRG
jgi:hypothetical protein